MLQTCLEFVLIQFGLYNSNYFPLENGAYGVFGFYNPEEKKKEHALLFKVFGLLNPNL